MSEHQAVEAAIDRWHDYEGTKGSLHEWLGWTWDEYRAYVERNELPPSGAASDHYRQVTDCNNPQGDQT